MSSYFEYADEFFNKNKTLRHSEMELEMQLINGYIHNFCDNLDVAKEAYMHSLKVSYITFNYVAINSIEFGILQSPIIM